MATRLIVARDGCGQMEEEEEEEEEEEMVEEERGV